MCAILDANVVSEVFGTTTPEAGERFRQWIDAESGRFVTGGKNFRELEQMKLAERWLLDAIRSGKIKKENDSVIDQWTEDIQHAGGYQSDDPHILALAKVSGARLLYSNDNDLRKDFKNRNLIDNPQGRIYSTLRNQSFTSTHRSLLRRRDLCLSGQ